jgi:hypothetical protein
MRVETGFRDGSAVVHLTETTLCHEPLCGQEELVAYLGEPDSAVMCEECDRRARALGLDPQAWLRTETVSPFAIAA